MPLDRSFVDCLTADGLHRIGRFGIDGPVFTCSIDDPEAADWLFAVYAWVSFAEGGKIVRIGKSEGPLAGRIGQYKKSLDTLASHILSARLGPNQYYAGDTPHWELEGWRRYTSRVGGGLIFAKQVTPQPGAPSAKKALADEELRLIRKYDPPLNGTSPSGRSLCKAWIEANGPKIPVSKRSGQPIKKPRA